MMKNILFINNALSGTGGARVILNLAKSLADRGNCVSILLDRVDNIQYDVPNGITLYVRDGAHVYPLTAPYIMKDNVSVKQNNSRGSLNFIKPYIKKIKNYIDFIKIPMELHGFKYFLSTHCFDIIINNNIYTKLDRTYYESIVSKNYYINFHNSPNEVFTRIEFSSVLSLSKIFSKTKLLSVSHGIAEELSCMRAFKQKIIQTIYNPFDFSELDEKSRKSIDTEFAVPDEFIVTVSTLTERKRVDRAIKAFSKIAKIQKKISLLIIGDGHLREQLNELASSLGISDRVYFLGFQNNPYFFMKNAKLLMLTSDSEGLPTVIIESLVLGTPVISTDCPTGPNEILNRWKMECLVSLCKRTDECIIEDIANKAVIILNKKYNSSEVREKANLARFDADIIAQQWEGLI